jgi:thiol peroxidase
MDSFRRCPLVLLSLIVPLALSGCAASQGDSIFSYQSLRVAKGTAAAGTGSTITFEDSSLTLAGPGIATGEALRSVKLAKGDLSLQNIVETKGNVRIISVDTPFAQDRFAKEARINNVTFLSDYRGGEFGRTHGLLLDGPHLLARAVMVVDKNNIIRYRQITPDLANMPDMEAAFAAARALL